MPATLIVALDDGVTAGQKRAVASALRAAPGARTVTYLSREEAYRRFKKVFKDDKPGLVNAARPESFPDSYHVTLAGGSAAKPVTARVRHLPGVKYVQRPPTASPSPR